MNHQVFYLNLEVYQLNLGVLQIYLLPGAPDPICMGLVALVIKYDKKKCKLPLELYNCPELHVLIVLSQHLSIHIDNLA